MPKLHTTLTLVLLAFISCNKQDSSDNITALTNTEFVNAFIGTGAHGHTYPGAQLPHGMVQVSPNNGKGSWDWISGYHYTDSVIIGFAHTHLSGAGIGDLTDILLMPTIKDIDLGERYEDRLERPYADLYSHENEKASPGFYSVNLKKSNIDVELTATERTGFHRYTFNQKGERNILLDLEYAQNWDKPTSTEITLLDDRTIVGKRFSTGWAKDQRVFFYLTFSEPIVGATATNNTDLKQTKEVGGADAKALFKFDSNLDEILVKVAISSVSIEGAKQNMLAENAEWNFDQIKQNGHEKWNSELDAIKIKSSDNEKKTLFYSSLYRAKLAPTLFGDTDGRYRGADTELHQANNFNYYTGLSLWDVFRTQYPLLTLIAPKVATDIAQTMIEHYNETGILPVWVLAGNETNTMTGYHSVSMLAEIIMKDLGDFDYEQAFQAMKNTMLQDQRGLKELKEYGYVPFNLKDESVTIALELAYNDYGVAMVAQKLGHTEDYEYFLNRSMAYQKIFDKSVGFMRGKDSEGNWRPDFDPKHSAHRKGTDYTEGNAWQHSWFVLHDIQGLVNEFGSEEAFDNKLTQLFNESSEITGDNTSPDITGLIGQYAHGNEPSHHIAYMYNYIGKPWKTQEMVHRIMHEQYSNTPEGVCGNEDMGQMSAWYVVSALGFYPVNPTDGHFVIGTPSFEEAEITLENGKSFIVKAKNLSDNHFYIKSASLNGEKLDRSFITYNEIMNGGVLEFEMSDQPNKEWATSPASRPPSISTGKATPSN